MQRALGQRAEENDMLHEQMSELQECKSMQEQLCEELTGKVESLEIDID